MESRRSATQRSIAYGAGSGRARRWIIGSTFEEENETDLVGEQALLCGVVSDLIKAGFDTLFVALYQQ